MKGYCESMVVAQDAVIEFIRNAASAESQIESVRLFGSRGRGAQGPRSDYDFAISAPEMSHAEWARWKLDTQEKAPTLCGVDLVCLEQLSSQNLQDVILREGVVIYEKN